MSESGGDDGQATGGDHPTGEWAPDPEGRHEFRYFVNDEPTGLVSDSGEESLDDHGEWVPDPTGRHEFRYFVSGKPTSAVSDHGVHTVDKPPSPPPGEVEPESPEPAAEGSAVAEPEPDETSAPEDSELMPSGWMEKRKALLLVGAVALAVVLGIGIALLSSGGDSESNTEEAAPTTTSSTPPTTHAPGPPEIDEVIAIYADVERDMAVGGGAVWLAGPGLVRVDAASSEAADYGALGLNTGEGLAFGGGLVWIGGDTFDGGSLTQLDPRDTGWDGESWEGRPEFSEAVGSGGGRDLDYGFGTLWAAKQPGSVARYDQGLIEVLSGPWDISVGGSGVWVANEDDTVVRIDPEDNSIAESVRVDGVYGLAADDSGVWFGVDGGLSRLVAGEGSVRPIDGVGDVQEVAYGEGAVWVAGGDPVTVRRINPETETVTDTVHVDIEATEDLAMAVGEGWVWLFREGCCLYRIFPGTRPTTTASERPTATTTAAPTTTTTAAPTTTTNPGSISTDEFNQITTGMSYAQAVNIIGGDGELMSQVDVAGYNTVTYSWTGQGGLGANAILMFQNDALVSKAQFGLG